MSGSTVSITANQTSTTRRRVVEKTRPSIDNVDVGEKTAVITTDTNVKPSAQTQTENRRSGPARKLTKPLWVTATSIVIKNLALLVVLLGFVQMVRWVVFNEGRDEEGLSGIYGDFDGRFAEVERFVKKTVTAMQVQLDAVDRKVDDGVSLVRKEFDEKMEKNGEEVDLKLKALDARSDAFEKFVEGFGTRSLLSKEEFGEFFEEFKKERRNGGEVSLDEVRNYARGVVEKEIEKHVADGLGMVDYALASGGGKVIRHSEPYGLSDRWSLNRNKVCAGAEKMISPSFGEPGNCFPLKGKSGFVEIALRTAIIPESATLEHVAKSVAYDTSSAPKQCRVSGWIHGQGGEIDSKKFLLAEFTYDLNKSNAQTFKVVDFAASTLVDTIRFDFTSNHGSASHTCIYRLRMHGHEPSSVPMLESRN